MTPSFVSEPPSNVSCLAVLTQTHAEGTVCDMSRFARLQRDFSLSPLPAVLMR